MSLLLRLSVVLMIGCGPAPSVQDGGATLVGSGGGGSGGGTASAGGSTQPGVLQGAYWSWRTENVTTFDPDGTVLTYPVLVYFFWVFEPNGFVYVGVPKPTLSEMHCSGPSVDSRGSRVCTMFRISNGQLTVGTDAPLSLSPNGAGWLLDGRELLPLPSQRGTTLEGRYRSYSCQSFSCSTVDMTFTAAGRYSVNFFRLVGSPPNGSPWDATWSAGGSSATGRYVIGEHDITFTPDNGPAKSAFFFRDLTPARDTVQVGDTWFSKKL